MERIFWLMSGSDSQVTRAFMEQFERTKSVRLPKELHSKVSHHSHTVEKGKGTATRPDLGFENLFKERRCLGIFLSTCYEPHTSAVYEDLIFEWGEVVGLEVIGLELDARNSKPVMRPWISFLNSVPQSPYL